MTDCDGFGLRIMDGLRAIMPLPVYRWVGDGFSVIDLAINGEDNTVEAYRITVKPLPHIFKEEE